jgi:hypothetical protein
VTTRRRRAIDAHAAPTSATIDASPTFARAGGA